MGKTVFSGADYRVLIGLPGSGLFTEIDTLENVSWTERRTENPDKDRIVGQMLLSRFDRHPLFSTMESLVGATTFGQLPVFDLHLQPFAGGEAHGTCCVITGIQVDRIVDGVSATDLGGSIAVHFLAEGVSHWESL